LFIVLLAQGAKKRCLRYPERCSVQAFQFGGCRAGRVLFDCPFENVPLKRHFAWKDIERDSLSNTVTVLIHSSCKRSAPPSEIMITGEVVPKNAVARLVGGAVLMSRMH